MNPIDELYSGINEMNEELSNINKNLANHVENEIDRINDRLTKEEKRLLDYFWDKKRNRVRDIIPVVVIKFHEKEHLNRRIQTLRELQVESKLLSVESKGYINIKGDNEKLFCTLTKKGDRYVYRKHPTIIRFWDQVLASIPPVAQIIITVLGLAASVIAITHFAKNGI